MYICVYIYTYKHSSVVMIIASSSSYMHSHIHLQLCSTLQHTTAHCNTLQHTATHCNTLYREHSANMCAVALRHGARSKVVLVRRKRFTLHTSHEVHMRVTDSEHKTINKELYIRVTNYICGSRTVNVCVNMRSTVELVRRKRLTLQMSHELYM